VVVALVVVVLFNVVSVCEFFLFWFFVFFLGKTLCCIILIYLSHQICSWAGQSLWDKVMTFICIIVFYIKYRYRMQIRSYVYKTYICDIANSI